MNSIDKIVDCRSIKALMKLSLTEQVQSLFNSQDDFAAHVAVVLAQSIKNITSNNEFRSIQIGAFAMRYATELNKHVSFNGEVFIKTFKEYLRAKWQIGQYSFTKEDLAILNMVFNGYVKDKEADTTVLDSLIRSTLLTNVSYDLFYNNEVDC